MVEDHSGRLVACLRLFQMRSGGEAQTGYAGQFYDLARLAALCSPMIEIGRFCVAPDVMDAEVVRVAWSALTRIVDAQGLKLLFGCSSFPGVDPAPYGHAFARLARKHQGPDALRPSPVAAEVVPFWNIPLVGRAPMPSLLCGYLAMGGWVGDHAVIDRVMGTMHVFTCLEVARVPPSRARALRALAQAAPLP